jgi:hypothetical protein
MAFDSQGRGGAAGHDDLYEVLGLTPDATPDEVDAAYHRLLNGLTSTSASSPAAVENLRRRRIRLANAYAVLADAEQRAAYDERMGLHAAAAPPPEAALPVSPVPDAGLPPIAMPDVKPRTTVPPMPMPEVTPRTAVPPMPMPEIQHPEPVRPRRATPVSAPAPATPLADLPAPSEDVEEQRLPAPSADLVARPVAVETPAEVAPEAAFVADGASVEDEPALADAAAAPVAEAGPGDEGEDETLPPVDDTPAPWETPTRRAPAAPVGKPRPAQRRPTPSTPPAPTPSSRAAGGIALPSRKVAEATPLPAPRSRAALTDAPTRPLSDDAAGEPPVPRSRPASRPAQTLPPIKQRSAAPVRRPARKNRMPMVQTIFYVSMALILAIGTIAGIVTSVGLPVGTTGTVGPGNTADALAQADAQLAAGNYSQAITLYNQVLTTSSEDPKALLGLAKAYYYKTPSEPDIAREYLARVFTSTGGGTDSPEANEALQLLSQIGLPGTPSGSAPAGTPGGSGTPGGTSVPATAGGTPLPPTVGSGTTGGTPGLPTVSSGATGGTPLPPTTGPTGNTPLPPTQAAPAGAPGASTATPGP